MVFHSYQIQNLELNTELVLQNIQTKCLSLQNMKGHYKLKIHQKNRVDTNFVPR